MSGAANVSAALGKWHTRASGEREQISGFVVTAAERTQDGTQVVPVGYQDYDYPGYSDAETEAVTRICEKAFDEYAATLRRAGYTVENWMKYDGTRLGLFVTGRS